MERRRSRFNFICIRIMNRCFKSYHTRQRSPTTSFHRFSEGNNQIGFNRKQPDWVQLLLEKRHSTGVLLMLGRIPLANLANSRSPLATGVACPRHSSNTIPSDQHILP